MLLAETGIAADATMAKGEIPASCLGSILRPADDGSDGEMPQ